MKKSLSSLATVWESMKSHHIYNVEDKPEFSRTYLKQEIKPVSENRYTKDYVSFWVPKDDFSQYDDYMEWALHESMEKNAEYEQAQIDAHVNDDEWKTRARRRNYKYWCFQLHFNYNDIDSLKEFAKRIFAAQERCSVSWTYAEGEDVTASIFFPAGCTKKFWDKYKAKKAKVLAELAEEHKPVIDEIKGLINQYDTAGQLSALQKVILKQEMHDDLKWGLYNECKAKIQQIC